MEDGSWKHGTVRFEFAKELIIIISAFYSPFMMVWDPTYVLIIIGMLLSLAASGMVRSTYAKYSGVRAMRFSIRKDMRRYPSAQPLFR